MAQAGPPAEPPTTPAGRSKSAFCSDTQLIIVTDSISTPREPLEKNPISMMRALTDTGPQLTPGDVNKVKTFVNRIWEREGQTAAYLGYTNLHEFRKFVVSPVMTECFVKVENTDRNKSRLYKVLELIQDLPKEMDSDEDPSKVYPRDYTGVLNSRVALAVVQASKSIEKARLERPSFTEQEIKDASASLTNALGQQFPSVSPGETVVYPLFSHFPDTGECELERYARIYTLIRYLGHSSYKDVFKGRYGSKNWDQEKGIGITHVPHWMRPKKIATESVPPDAPIIPSVLEKPPKPAVSVKIIWRYRSTIEEAAEYRRYIEEEEPELKHLLPLDEDMRIQIEPEASKEEFLDLVRATFHMDKNRANIFHLQLVLVNPDVDVDDEDKERVFTVFKTLWENVQSGLWESDWDKDKSAFHLITRLADEGEIIWETSPLAEQAMWAQDTYFNGPATS